MVDQAEIHRLVLSKDASEWKRAVILLSENFAVLHDQKQAWYDLILLSLGDKPLDVALAAINALGVAFTNATDKNQAWGYIHYLSMAKDYVARSNAAMVISAIFPLIQDKKQAWKDLLRLTKDEKQFVRGSAARALAAAFPHIPKKKQIWKQAQMDLIRLRKDKDGGVRASANYCIGKICIFKATEAESEKNFRKELEKAIGFFEEASKEKTFLHPVSFCLPFYKSFYTIVFRKREAEANIHNYLAAAKRAVGSSKSKEMLLEAVENLANALREVHRAEEMSLEGMKCDLNAYRRYCDRAEDLLDATEEKVPRATKLIRRGLPIIDQKIKEILTEIQENAKALCKQTKDTPLEDLGKEVNRAGQTFPQIRDPIGLEKGFINLWTALSSICAKMPEEERGEACELLKKAGDEPYIEDKLTLINMILSKISSQISAAKNIETVEKKLDEIIVSLKPGIRQELIITVGAEFAGTGAQHVITVPLQEISYPDLKNDLEKIKGKGILKLASLPAKLAGKVKDYLIRNKNEELIKHLS